MPITGESQGSGLIWMDTRRHINRRRPVALVGVSDPLRKGRKVEISVNASCDREHNKEWGYSLAGRRSGAPNCSGRRLRKRLLAGN
jgi:hypothetical protein